MQKELTQRQITKKKNKLRRSAMLIKVFSFNIHNSKLSQAKKSYLKLLKLEAKFYYNYLIRITQSITDDFGFSVRPVNIFEFLTKSNHIKVFWGGDYIDYELKVLSSQMKQGILFRIQDSIKGLSKRKSKGFGVGNLKFKSIVNIPLNQLGVTYRLSNDCKKLKIQGSKDWFPLVRNKNLVNLSKNLGLGRASLKKLIDLGVIDLANAELVGDKLNVTVYCNAQALKDTGLFQGSRLPALKDVSVGLDAGVKSEATINVGERFAAIDFDARNTLKIKKLKKYQKQFNRHISKCKKKKSKVKTRKFYKLNDKINRLYDDITNEKKDQVNKLISIFKECKQVTFQDENIKAWHSNKAFGFSKKIQKGILGRLYYKLKMLSKKDGRFRQLDRSLRTTKTCICARVNHQIGLKDRVFGCLPCGYLNDRDIHSSYIINNAINYLGSGIESKDQETRHDLVLDSNLEKMIASVTSLQFKAVMDSKLKSKSLRIKLNQFSEHTQDAPLLAAGQFTGLTRGVQRIDEPFQDTVTVIMQ